MATYTEEIQGSFSMAGTSEVTGLLTEELQGSYQIVESYGRLTLKVAAYTSAPTEYASMAEYYSANGFADEADFLSTVGFASLAAFFANRGVANEAEFLSQEETPSLEDILEDVGITFV